MTCKVIVSFSKVFLFFFGHTFFRIYGVILYFLTLCNYKSNAFNRYFDSSYGLFFFYRSLYFLIFISTYSKFIKRWS